MKEFFRDMGLTKVFTFRGKRYRWTCTIWQAVILSALSIVAFYGFIMFFFILECAING